MPDSGNFIPIPPHLEIHPPPAGDRHAQRLRPHQPRRRGLRPGISGARGYRPQRHPQPLPEFIKGTETAVRETLEALEIYRQSLDPDFWAVELNYSCPNSAEEITKNVAQGIACSWPCGGSILTYS